MLQPGIVRWAAGLWSLTQKSAASGGELRVGRVRYVAERRYSLPKCRRMIRSWPSREDRDRGLVRTFTSQLFTHWKF